MVRLKILVASLLLVTSCVAIGLPASRAYADDPLAEACSSAGASASPNCAKINQTDNPLVGSNGLLTKITKIIAVIAGFAGVLMVILGGFNYITSAGDAQKAKKSRDMIVGALIGLVIVVLAQFIITFVLKKL